MNKNIGGIKKNSTIIRKLLASCVPEESIQNICSTSSPLRVKVHL